MQNLTELINAANKNLSKDNLKNAIIKSMDNVDNIEELLILKWHLGKVFLPNIAIEKETNFPLKIENICYKKALKNSSSIIEDIIKDYSMEQLVDKYNVTRESIIRIVANYLETNNYDKKILSKLKKFNKVFVPEHDRETICATTAIKMFIDNKCYTTPQIYTKFNCTYQEVDRYLKILGNVNNSLYEKYLSLNKESIANDRSIATKRKNIREREKFNNVVASYGSLSPNEVREVLSNPTSKSFAYFCIYYGFNKEILKQLLIDNEDLIDLLVSTNNKETMIAIYNQYISNYKTLFKQIIREIIMLNKDGFTKPLNLYKYYSKTKFDIKTFTKLSSAFTDIKNRNLLLRYLDHFFSILEAIDQNTLNSLKEKNMLSCCKDTITYTNEDLSGALADIKEKGMPLQKGVLYCALKKQIDLKDGKVKKKA